MKQKISNPWVCRAYGIDFVGAGPRAAMDTAEAYGERHQLRAVSLTAHRVVGVTTTPTAPTNFVKAFNEMVSA